MTLAADTSHQPPAMTPLPTVEIIFKDGLPFDCTCPKCEQALRSPMRTPCEHYFCRTCIEGVNGMVVCLVCKTEFPESAAVPDKQKHRQVQSLLVKCSYEHLGCPWIGPLMDLMSHTSDCTWKGTACQNCGKLVAEKDVQNHLSECQKAIIKCEHCQTAIKASSRERHLKICLKVIMSCPFHCGLVDKTREEINAHRSNCPNAGNACPFAEFGCNFAADRTGVQAHLSEEPVKHMIFLCDEVAELRKYYALMQDELSCIGEKHEDLIRRTVTCEEMFGPQMIWRIDNVVQRQNEAKSGARTTIFSPPFMSGRHGYKMLASACLFGDGISRGQSLSLYATLTRGEYDSLLEWPFRMMIKFTLLDQNPRMEDRVDVSYTVDPRRLSDNSQFLMRPLAERNASFGAQAFCSLDIMENYVKDDVMFVRIDVDHVEKADFLNKDWKSAPRPRTAQIPMRETAILREPPKQTPKEPHVVQQLDETATPTNIKIENIATI